MQIVSVNTSPARPVNLAGEKVVTGICKQPITGRTMIREQGLTNDGVGNTKYHGGPDQAVYALASEYYDYWRKELGREDLPYGTFGENLTVRGWLDHEVHIGDTYRVGEAQVVITGVRVPCATLEKRVGIRGFAKQYAQGRRYGMYMRVTKPGKVDIGDEVSLIKKSDSGVSVVELGELYLFRPKDVEGMKRALAAEALSERGRAAFEKRVAQAVAADA